MLAVPVFWIVQGRSCPDEENAFKAAMKEELQAGEPFESEFIGASEDECIKWLADLGYHCTLDSSIFGIADAQSAEDETVLMKCFVQALPPLTKEEIDAGVPNGWYFPKFGRLPPRDDVWYEWRIHYKYAFNFYAAMTTTAPDAVYPYIYGMKEDFTDERGVFDIEHAHTHFLSECSGKTDNKQEKQ